jgi:hypothetical protein
MGDTPYHGCGLLPVPAMVTFMPPNSKFFNVRKHTTRDHPCDFIGHDERKGRGKERRN